MSCLCILEINPLSVALSAIVFSHSESFLFTLFIVSFAVQKVLHLIRPYLFIFVFKKRQNFFLFIHIFIHMLLMRSLPIHTLFSLTF